MAFTKHPFIQVATGNTDRQQDGKPGVLLA
jgi:hypothetical protein